MVNQEFMQQQLDEVRQKLIEEFREGEDLESKIEEVESQIEDIENQMPIKDKEEWYGLLNSLREELNDIQSEAGDIHDKVSETNGHLGKISRKFVENDKET